jgi:carboxymethylenebutenolidase
MCPGKKNLIEGQQKSDRRTFLRKLGYTAGGTFALFSYGPVKTGDDVTGYYDAQQELKAEFISYQGHSGDMRAYMAFPGKGKKFPCVIVIHENRGLVPHIQDVTRRFAAEGFLALAPDALSPVGGTPEDVSNVGEKFRQLNPEETTKNFVAAVKYLKTHPRSTGKVGCTGFCWGGAMTNQVAANAPDLDAAVPYYGRQPSEEDVARIKAPVLAHYAENDPGINSGIEAFREALKKNGKEFQIFIYEGTQHAFNNDSNPQRYNEKAAKLAWSRTVEFFKDKLK